MGDFLIALFRFLLSVVLLPIGIACTLAFKSHLGDLPANYEDFVLWGLFAVLLTFLFFAKFQTVFTFGQDAMSKVFQFFSPVERIMATIFPFYLMLVLIAFLIVHKFVGNYKFDHYFIFFASFFLGMHALVLAQELQEGEKSVLKPAYLFEYILFLFANITIFILFIDLIIGKWTYGEFFTGMVAHAKEIYLFAINKLIK